MILSGSHVHFNLSSICSQQCKQMCLIITFWYLYMHNMSKIILKNMDFCEEEAKCLWSQWHGNESDS